MEDRPTTPEEALFHIAYVYSQCDTFDKIKEKGLNEFICISLLYICDEETWRTTRNLIKENYELSKVGTDLLLNETAFWNTAKATVENREKECIQLKVDFINKLIELIQENEK